MFPAAVGVRYHAHTSELELVTSVLSQEFHNTLNVVTASGISQVSRMLQYSGARSRCRGESRALGIRMHGSPRVCMWWMPRHISESGTPPFCARYPA